MKKGILSVLSSIAVFGAVLFGLVQQPTISHGYDYRYYFDKYDITVVENPQINTQFPYWARPNPKQDITDLNYWIATIPYAQDREADAYLVYPKAGVATVVLRPNEKDQFFISQGQMFDHYKYLQNGALHYYGTGPTEGNGNMVIAAHSSFKKDDPGRYNTVFQTLPITREGDKIFYYERTEGNTYDLYVYTVEDSFETHSYDTSILAEKASDEKTLTTYGCYTLGTNKDRRVNVATLTDTKEALAVSQPKVYAHLATFSKSEHAAAGEQPEAWEQPEAELQEKIQENPVVKSDSFDDTNDEKQSESVIEKTTTPKVVQPTKVKTATDIASTPYGNIPSYIKNSQQTQSGHPTQTYVLPDAFVAEYQPMIDKIRFLIKLQTNENIDMIRILAERIQERFGVKAIHHYSSKKEKLLHMLLETMDQFVQSNAVTE